MRWGFENTDEMKAVMNLPELKYDFSGTTIEEARAGPRRELVLVLRSMAGAPFSQVRFGGIQNFGTIASSRLAATSDPPSRISSQSHRR